MRLDQTEIAAFSRWMRGDQAARAVLADSLVARAHPWGTALLHGSVPSDPLWDPVLDAVTRGHRAWAGGVLVGARLRTRRSGQLQDSPLWQGLESLELGAGQSGRADEVARWLRRLPWPRLKRLAVLDSRLVPALLERPLPQVDVLELDLRPEQVEAFMAVVPETARQLAVRLIPTTRDADVGRRLLEHPWAEVHVGLAEPWWRDVCVGRVERVRFEHATFVLLGDAVEGGFDWSAHELHDAPEHLWRFVRAWPERERDQVFPGGAPALPHDPRDHW